MLSFFFFPNLKLFRASFFIHLLFSSSSSHYSTFSVHFWNARSGSEVNLSFHKSHWDTPGYFLYFLTQHQGRIWESELWLWTQTKCFFFCPSEYVLQCRGSSLGSDFSSGGSDPLCVEDVCQFRGQGCNQTSGRLPRVLSSILRDSGLWKCSLFYLATWYIWVFLYFSLNPDYSLFSSHSAPSIFSWTASRLLLASSETHSCHNDEMIAVSSEW